MDEHTTITIIQAAGKGLWLGRPVECPGSRPLQLEAELGDDCGGLQEWPLEQIVKSLCFYHPDDSAKLRAEQIATLRKLFAACRRHRLEWLVEIIPSAVGDVDETTTARAIEQLYEAGLYPDWWKLEPMKSAAAWQQTCDMIWRFDPHVQGIVVLGLEAPINELQASFDLAAQQPMVKGFAIGRSIFAQVAKAWFAGNMDDDTAIQQMTLTYQQLCQAWDNARAAAGDNT